MKRITKKEYCSSLKRVAIILGYYNGRTFINSQINSIFKQTHNDFHIFLFDDNSTYPFDIKDLSLNDDQISKFSYIIRPQNIGFSNNFLKGLTKVNNNFDYYSFCDQDDIWFENKLEKAIKELSKFSPKISAIYCGRTEVSNKTCTKKLGYSPLFKQPPSFANALVQNIGGGNTMVFNKAAKKLIITSLKNANVVSHDWWCYQIVSGAGGNVIYDSIPYLKYRQHSHNLVGSNNNWTARLIRINKLLKGYFRSLNDINLRVLEKNKHLLTKANVSVLNDFKEARQSHLIKRIKLLKRSGIYRQTFFGNIGLLVAAILNKV